jgi:NADH dehydrogenase FAD-containing subunit
MGGKHPKALKDAPTVVIVGGGYAGVKLAKALDATMNVVLIDRKDYFLHNSGTPRGMVDAEFAKKLVIPYNQLLKNGQVLKGQVVKISAKEVQVHGLDEPIKDFDYLVIATGTSYAFPYKVPESEAAKVNALYERAADKIKEAKSVVVVGAGSTGLEAASEIAETYPEKQVTIVHSGEKVMPGPWSPKFVDHLQEQIQRYKNLKLVLNDRLLPVEADGGDEVAQQKYVEPVGGKVTTKNGAEIPCDLLFWCVGGRINKASYEEHFKEQMDEKGVLNVDEFLRVKGYSNVFAIGDICSAGPMPTIVCATAHSELCAKNIPLLHAGKSMKPFKAGPPLNITTLGKTMGSVQLPIGGMVRGSKTAQLIKGDMFVGNMWKEMGFDKKASKEPQTSTVADVDVTKLEGILTMSDEEREKLAEGLKPAEGENVENT